MLDRGPRAGTVRWVCEVSKVKGEVSDLLLEETAEAMRDRGPRALVVTIDGCGHAPALNVPEQLALIRRFLNGA